LNQPTKLMNAILRSTVAVLAGFFAVVGLSIVTDAILENAGIFPPPSEGLFVTWMLLLAFGYRTVYNVIGGYITAALAPIKPVRHAFILGCVGTVGGGIGVYVGWDMSDHWYPIALMVEAIPTCWLGGKLKSRQTAQSGQTTKRTI
jgi:hypothetical protein